MICKVGFLIKISSHPFNQNIYFHKGQKKNIHFSYMIQINIYWFFGNETSVNLVSSRDLTKSLILFLVILQLVTMFLSVLSLKLSFCADWYSDINEGGQLNSIIVFSYFLSFFNSDNFLVKDLRPWMLIKEMNKIGLFPSTFCLFEGLFVDYFRG